MKHHAGLLVTARLPCYLRCFLEKCAEEPTWSEGRSLCLEEDKMSESDTLAGFMVGTRPLTALTLWRPLLPYGSYIIASCYRPDWAVICNFWHQGTLTLRAERQRARMSKITNDGSSRSGVGCYKAVPMWQQWASKG